MDKRTRRRRDVEAERNWPGRMYPCVPVCISWMGIEKWGIEGSNQGSSLVVASYTRQEVAASYIWSGSGGQLHLVRKWPPATPRREQVSGDASACQQDETYGRGRAQTFSRVVARPELGRSPAHQKVANRREIRTQCWHFNNSVGK